MGGTVHASLPGMSGPSDKITVHTRKFYRVVLEEIDTSCETKQSFAIKLSMRTRTPLPRVQHVVRRLPYTIKSGLSSSQANRLKSILEEIGGRARLETHFVTPGEAHSPTQADRAPQEMVEVKEGERLPCPSCGWDEEPGVEFCSFCQEPIGAPEGGGTEESRSEEPDATGVEEVGQPAPDPPAVRRTLADNIYLIAALLLVILLAILIFKQ